MVFFAGMRLLDDFYFLFCHFPKYSLYKMYSLNIYSGDVLLLLSREDKLFSPKPQ